MPRSPWGWYYFAADSLRKLPLAIAATVFLGFLVAMFSQYIAQSDYFAMHRIEVSGPQRLSQDAIVKTIGNQLGIERGVSFLYVDAEEVRDALLEIPEIQSAEVEKVWPDTLYISIRERQPAGILVSASGSFVFDSEGFLFAEARGPDFLRSTLPVLTGFSGLQAQHGVRIPAEPLSRLMEYRRLFAAASPETAARISELHWDDLDGVSLVLDRGQRFLCGFRPPAETGPLVELFLETETEAGRITSASLYSDLYVTVSRESAGKTGSTMAKSR